MARKQVPVALVILLVTMGVGAILLNTLVFFDLPWFRLGRSIQEEAPIAEQWEGVRDSVFLVHLPRCDGNGRNSGTAFAVHPGYLVTNAHVVGDSVACSSEIRVVDSKGRDQKAELDSYSDELDLALLKITDENVPVLPLADSALYEDMDEVLRIYTVGYPLVGTASTPDRASFSGVGSISQYEERSGVFIISGVNVNPGNSGGPVLFEDRRLVLGVASAKLDPTVGGDIGYVIPAKALKDYFFDKTGQELGSDETSSE